MEKTPIFEITTTMEKEDYRNFLYLTTFQKPDSILSLLLLSVLLGFVTTLAIGFSLVTFLSSSFVLFLILFSFLSFKLENAVKKMYPLDRPCAFSKTQTISFYKTYLTSSNRSSEGLTETSYPSLYKGVENQNYIILYLTKELASVIRKKDLKPETLKELSLFLLENIPVYIKK